jgi:hypothetical protein
MMSSLLGRNVRLLILVDIAIFVFLVRFQTSFKLFFMLVTSGLVCYLFYKLINYLINLNELNVDLTKLENSKTSENELFQLKMKMFLFKNEHFYKLIKNVLLNKNYIQNQFDKMLIIPSVSNDLGKSDSIGEFLSIEQELELFFRKFSKNFIETWYSAYISNNEQFLNEANSQLVLILNNLISRLVALDKLSFFSTSVSLFNKNFLEVYMSSVNKPIDFNLLHPAVRSVPNSEVAYLKRVVQIILRKSAANLNLDSNLFVDEFFMQIIGKNVVENIVNLLARPNFIYFVLAFIVNKKKTREEFNYDPANENMDDSIVSLEGSDADQMDVSHMNSSEILESDLTFDSEDKLKFLTAELKKIDEEFMMNQTNLRNQEVMEPFKAYNKLNLEILNIFINKTETAVEKSSGKEYTNYFVEV